MELYAQSGQQAAALRQYQECERILDQELGIPPQPETMECYQRIRLHRQPETHPSLISSSEVKFVSSGDVTIAYQVFGDGPLDIVWVSGFITHMEQLWKLPSLASFFTKLAEFSRVITFDRRGVGLSDRVGYPPTLEDTMEDMCTVLLEVGSTHAVLFGYLEGGPNSMLFAATYPEHVSGLVLYGTAAKWAQSEDYPWAITHDQYDLWLRYISDNWGEPLNLETYAPSYAQDPQLQEWFAETLRLGSSPGGLKAVLEVMRNIDVRDVLPTIRIPTLILHRKGDRAVRVGAGRYLASRIPNAKYVELEGQDHWFFVGDSQPILDEIQTFVQDLGSPPVPERMLSTILIIEVMEDLPVPSAHTDIASAYPHLRREVGRYRGNEVSWSHGRYTATFDGPSRAIRCAKAIQNIAHLRSIKLRAGLHTGECEFTAGALAGTAVQIAQGVLETAAANEVLVSNTVKDLVVGSGFMFTEVGTIVVDGVSQGWKIFAVEQKIRCYSPCL
jgi:pimeloyl-ACP methyl ester carboxylesterase